MVFTSGEGRCCKSLLHMITSDLAVPTRLFKYGVTVSWRSKLTPRNSKALAGSTTSSPTVTGKGVQPAHRIWVLLPFIAK